MFTAVNHREPWVRLAHELGYLTSSPDGLRHLDVQYNPYFRYSSAALSIIHDIHEPEEGISYDPLQQMQVTPRLGHKVKCSTLLPMSMLGAQMIDSTWTSKEAEMEIRYFEGSVYEDLIGMGHHLVRFPITLRHQKYLSPISKSRGVDIIQPISHELDMFRTRQSSPPQYIEVPPGIYHKLQRSETAKSRDLAVNRQDSFPISAIERERVMQVSKIPQTSPEKMRRATEEPGGVSATRHADIESMKPAVPPPRIQSDEKWSTCVDSLSESFSGLIVTESDQFNRLRPYRALVPLTPNALLAPSAQPPARSPCVTEPTTLLSTDSDENVKAGKTKKTFACKFCSHDAQQYQSCANLILRNISNLKKHLKKKHIRPAHYCPRCYFVFGCSDKKDDHVREGLCSPSEKRMFADKLNDEAVRLLSPRICVRRRGQTADNEEARRESEKVWMKLYRAQFGADIQLPKSPYACDIADQTAVKHLSNILAAYPEARRLIQEKTTAHLETNTALPQDTQMIIEQALEVRHEVHEDHSGNVNAQDTSTTPHEPAQQTIDGRDWHAEEHPECINPTELSGSTLLQIDDLFGINDWPTDIMSAWESLDPLHQHFPLDFGFQENDE